MRHVWSSTCSACRQAASPSIPSLFPIRVPSLCLSNRDLRLKRCRGSLVSQRSLRGVSKIGTELNLASKPSLELPAPARAFACQGKNSKTHEPYTCLHPLGLARPTTNRLFTIPGESLYTRASSVAWHARRTKLLQSISANGIGEPSYNALVS